MSSKKKKFSCVCINVHIQRQYITKNNIEAVKYNGKKWINEKDFGFKNLAGNKTQYSDEIKKRRCKIQDCEDCQPCRKFIAEESAIRVILDTKTVKVG